MQASVTSVMAALPVEVLYGVYLGVLTGIIPALVAWSLGFVFRYFTGVTVPGLAVVVLGVAIAGVNGGLLALNDPTITESAYQIRLTVALVVVLMGTLYAHSAGDKMGQAVPRRISLRELTERTLSTDVVELVGGRGQVRVSVAGDVGDIEGYPPLPASVREDIRDEVWTFPADVPLVELETRVADRLRTEFDLPAVDVRLDERARATVAAAPPMGALSKRIGAGKRAVSVSALVPTGVARGDEVAIHVGESSVHGTVVSANSGDGATTARDAGRDADGAGDVDAPSTEGGPTTDGGTGRPATPAPTTTGGEGRITVAVDRNDAASLLDAPPDRVVVRSRGVRREFELVSLLKRAGKRFRKLAVADGGALDGTTLGEASVRDAYGVAVLAIRHEGRWVLAPHGDQSVEGGDDLFAVGTREALDAFAEAVS